MSKEGFWATCSESSRSSHCSANVESCVFLRRFLATHHFEADSCRPTSPKSAQQISAKSAYSFRLRAKPAPRIRLHSTFVFQPEHLRCIRLLLKISVVLLPTAPRCRSWMRHCQSRRGFEHGNRRRIRQRGRIVRICHRILIGFIVAGTALCG